MNPNLIVPPDAVDELRCIGLAFVSGWKTDAGTLQLARSIATVVDMEELLPSSGITTVQTLRPRTAGESGVNRYSGNFGLGEFPLHTDLAHWARPPRYFMLRCQSGTSSVITRLLPASAIRSAVGIETIRRAIVRPRKRPVNTACCPLSVELPVEGLIGLRWDQVFLIPMNAEAEHLGQVMDDKSWDPRELIEIKLASPGDTLIVDNWRLLHGRSCVPADETRRCVERVYLSGINL
jgi:L-asparagine oxygenase